MYERNDTTNTGRDRRMKTGRDEAFDFSCDAQTADGGIKPLFMQACRARVSMLSWLVTVLSSITRMTIFAHLNTEYILRRLGLLFQLVIFRSNAIQISGRLR